MHHLYILKSKKDGKLYIGYTSDLRKRIERHTKGLVPATKLRRPLILVYYEAYRNRDEAIRREHNLKLRARALAQLKLRIAKSIEEF